MIMPSTIVKDGSSDMRRTLLTLGIVLLTCTHACYATDQTGQSDTRRASLERKATKAAAAWQPTTHMVFARYGHTATLLPDGKVLVAGGFGGPGGGALLAISELYDPVHHKWSKAGAMVLARQAHQTALLTDGSVLVAGGFARDSSDLSATSSAEVYSPSKGIWHRVGSMTMGRLGHTMTVLKDGRVLVTGGHGADDVMDEAAFATAELFNPADGQWTATASMTVGRRGHTATLLPNGKVLVVGGRTGGHDGDATASAELFDPAKGTWAAAARMTTPRYGHSATLLPSGKVLVVGGEEENKPDEETKRIDAAVAEVAKEKGSNFTSADLTVALAKDPAPYRISAEIYDPATNQWSSTGSLKGARSRARAVLLPNGNVLVTRGADGNSIDLDSAEIYDSATGAWHFTGPMNKVVGIGATLTVLPDGTVLAAGGDRGYVKSKPGFRERLAQGIYREDDFNDNSALSSAELLRP
jgi:N-acetylneuraminic acid mutarotase